MKRNSGNTSVLIGVCLLASVALGMGGIAYSFYRSEAAREEQESSDMANDDSPFEQLKKDNNMVTTPVTEPQGGSGGGSGGINFRPEGIPTGTYSNPSTSISSFGSENPTQADRPLENLGSSVERNRLSQERIGSDTPDYSRPSPSNNFNSTSENSLVQPLGSDDLLEAPSTSTTKQPETSPLTESSF